MMTSMRSCIPERKAPPLAPRFVSAQADNLSRRTRQPGGTRRTQLLLALNASSALHCLNSPCSSCSCWQLLGIAASILSAAQAAGAGCLGKDDEAGTPGPSSVHEVASSSGSGHCRTHWHVHSCFPHDSSAVQRSQVHSSAF